MVLKRYQSTAGYVKKTTDADADGSVCACASYGQIVFAQTPFLMLLKGQSRVFIRVMACHYLSNHKMDDMCL
jgi:hypothetical protein